MIICFDVDGCLFNVNGTPRMEVINFMGALHDAGHEIWVWSGGGIPYAIHKCQQIDVPIVFSRKYKTDEVDVCFDDENVSLAKTNIKI